MHLFIVHYQLEGCLTPAGTMNISVYYSWGYQVNVVNLCRSESEL